MSLTNISIKNAAVRNKDYKLFDEKGLFLLIRKSGAKYWRFRFRIRDKEKLLSLGTYPTVSLKQARIQAEEYRQQLRKGEDPSLERKLKKHIPDQQQTFEIVARRWHKMNVPRWSERYAMKILQLLERRVFPFIGATDITAITNADILLVLRKMEADGVRETTRKVRTYIQQVFTFAIAEGIADNNPATGVIHALKALPPADHQRSLPFVMLPSFVHAIKNDSAHPVVKLGLQLLILTMTRTGEVRFAHWHEIDFEKRLWTIPSQRMKTRNEHLIPLSEQALLILKQLHQHTGHGSFIVHSPNARKKPLSDNAFLTLINRIGFKQHTTAHGLRATASTALNEAGFRADVIEKQLAHEERNQVRKAYNRADYLDERRTMLQWWANQLEPS